VADGDEISALMEGLEAAFGGLPVPADDRLVLDDSGNHLECNQVKALFRGRHWRDLSPEDLEGEADSLSFLAPEGFRFFLPAFVRVSLLDFERADLIPMAVIGALTQPEDPDLQEYLSSRLGTLDAGQRRVLKEFLAFLRRRYEAYFLPGELERAEESLDKAS
jgi:hypothetical protein